MSQKPLSRATESLLVGAVTLALLVPCVWQSHIQAGDLSSHLYNAWLAGQIKQGAVSGLVVVGVWTNVLGDWLLTALLPRLGVTGTERVVVGAAVLVFFWGAFYLVNTATGRRSLLLAPCLGMLSYGLIFHFGFLNYYLSTGLCLWVLALLWRPSKRRALFAAPILILALLAHVLPVAWALTVLLYLEISRRIPARRWFILPLGGLAGLLLVQTILMNRYPYRWSLEGLISLGGLAGLASVEQVWLFAPKYLIVVAGLFLIWSLLFLERLDQGRFLADPVAQLWMLHVAAFALLPSAIQFPGYQHVFAYIPQRISLLSALFLCITVGGARQGRGMTRLCMLVATIFFTFVYVDSRAFNEAESEVTTLVSSVAPGQRVVGSISDTGSRLNATAHVIDRACIGHCFSYGNYEPATAQFRIRVLAPNQVVASTMTTVQEIEQGRHVVTESEAPLYSVCGCPKPEVHRFCLRALEAGERTCSIELPLSPWGGTTR